VVVGERIKTYNSAPPGLQMKNMTINKWSKRKAANIIWRWTGKLAVQFPAQRCKYHVLAGTMLAI
jgi:hypothetical protein